MVSGMASKSNALLDLIEEVRIELGTPKEWQLKTNFVP